MEQEGGESEKLLGEEEGSASGRYPKGRTVQGQAYIVKERWLSLDGNRLHYTLPFEGIRFSLIYFVVSRFENAPADVRVALCERGFDFEWDERRVRSLTDPLKLPLGVPDRPGQVHAWAQETALPEIHEE